jgi:hypothetical protein
VYGFKPEAFGLTEAQAADIALIFARCGGPRSAVGLPAAAAVAVAAAPPLNEGRPARDLKPPARRPAKTPPPVADSYDTNDDGRLDISELRRLCDALDGEACPLDEGEWQAALQLMDTNRDGVVEFDEFVAYYQKVASKAATA